MFGFIIIAVVGALAFALINFIIVKRKNAGTDKMKEIAEAIQERRAPATPTAPDRRPTPA